MPYAKVKRSDLQFGQELGRGGFSTVYHAIWILATTRTTGEVTVKKEVRETQVAVKKLNAKETSELEIMSKIDHSHIVKLLGVVDETPDFYLVLELCTGGALRKYLDKLAMKRLPFTQFRDWMKQAALPIKYLQEKGVVHKDIKSPNYMIADQNILKLGDFGTAKEIDITMSNATTTASYPWMAPELLKDEKLSPNYDIFSFGVVVWELWTTEYPHKGLEPQVIAWRVCQKNERLSIPGDCPILIAQLIWQCWNKDWTKRPSIDHILSVIAETARQRQLLPKLTTQRQLTPKATRQRQLRNGQRKLKRKISVNGSGKRKWPYGISRRCVCGRVV